MVNIKTIMKRCTPVNKAAMLQPRLFNLNKYEPINKVRSTIKIIHQ